MLCGTARLPFSLPVVPCLGPRVRSSCLSLSFFVVEACRLCSFRFVSPVCVFFVVLLYFCVFFNSQVHRWQKKVVVCCCCLFVVFCLFVCLFCSLYARCTVQSYVLRWLSLLPIFTGCLRLSMSPRGLTCWGCCGLCFRHKPAELDHSFSFCSCVYFCLYGPFNSISFQKFSRQLSAFSLRSSGLISASLVLSTMYLFMKVLQP